MKFKFDKFDKTKWHEKFAWIPVKVHDDPNKIIVVFAEKYMRRGMRGNSGFVYEKHSKKEYFKQKAAW